MCQVLSPVCKGWQWVAPNCWLLSALENRRSLPNSVSGKYPCQDANSTSSTVTTITPAHTTTETASSTTPTETSTTTMEKNNICAEFDTGYYGYGIVGMENVFSYFQCFQLCQIFSPLCRGWQWTPPSTCWL